MEVVESLRRAIGSVVTIEFYDGEVVDAEILQLDGDDHHDFTFDVRLVRVATANTDYSKAGAYVMPIKEVRYVRLAQ